MKRILVSIGLVAVVGGCGGQLEGQDQPTVSAESTCGTQYTVIGAILTHYNNLGGCTGLLRLPTTNELGTPDGVGRFNHFINGNSALVASANGSIYYHPDIGAVEVHGEIRKLWAETGWEQGPLGYPTHDEYNCDVTVFSAHRCSDFQYGTIVWDGRQAVATLRGKKKTTQWPACVGRGSDGKCNACPPPPDERCDCVPPSRVHFPCKADHCHTFVTNQDENSCCCYPQKSAVICYDNSRAPGC